MRNICRNCDFFEGNNLTELGTCKKYMLNAKHELSYSCSQFINEKKAGIERLRNLYEKYSDEEIAQAILDATHELFNENNFTYYDYYIRIAYEINKQVEDRIISKDRADRIHKEISKLSNKMINEIIGNRCDKCCGTSK